MALTPNSGLASWLTAMSFLTFCDWRPLGMLLKDDNIAADYVSLTTAGTPANLALMKFLQAACGTLEVALLRGNRYQAADLANLPATSNAAAFRDQLLAKVAQQAIFRRRPTLLKEYEALTREVNETLKALADGEAIFPFLETQAAGLIDVEPETAADVQARQLVAVQARRYFGTRGNQVRNGPGSNGFGGGYGGW